MSEHLVALTLGRLASLGILTGTDVPEFVHPIVPRSLRQSLACALAGSGYGLYRALPPATERISHHCGR